jgi:hypothetical protein
MPRPDESAPGHHRTGRSSTSRFPADRGGDWALNRQDGASLAASTFFAVTTLNVGLQLSNQDAFNLIEDDLIVPAVVELGRSR